MGVFSPTLHFWQKKFRQENFRTIFWQPKI